VFLSGADLLISVSLVVGVTNVSYYTHQLLAFLLDKIDKLTSALAEVDNC
jgi:hypothetical protein